jgi:F-type H+-transporting ATPase subunit alpha
MDSVPVEKARAFEKEFYALLDSSYPDALQLILKGDIDGAGKMLATAAAELAPKYAK